MGGYGSTRWGWRRRATTVEDCHPLPISVALRSGGAIAWQVDGHETDRISLTLRRNADGAPAAATLDYSIILDGARAECRYDVAIVTRATAAGIVQRLWRCPLMQRHVPCGRTVRTLYLPPGARSFGCRHCHRLVYRSAQTHDKHAHRRLHLLLAQADQLTRDHSHHECS